MELSADTGCNMDELKNIMLCKKKRPHIIWFHFYDLSRISKSTETESKSICQGLGKGEHGYRVSFLGDGNILKWMMMVVAQINE